jgi:hypothetical protein
MVLHCVVCAPARQGKVVWARLAWQAIDACRTPLTRDALELYALELCAGMHQWAV